jgi:hypothetical protein
MASETQVCRAQSVISKRLCGAQFPVLKQGHTLPHVKQRTGMIMVACGAGRNSCAVESRKARAGRREAREDSAERPRGSRGNI